MQTTIAQRTRIAAASLWSGGALLLANTFLPAHADELSPGAHVRITASGVQPATITGTLVAIDNQVVTVQVPGLAAPTPVPRTAISDVSIREDSRSRGVGALIGAGLGGVAGAVVGATQSNGRYINKGEATAASIGVGVALGAVIGFAIPPGERWKPLGPLHVGLVPGPNRVVALTVSTVF